MRMHAVKFVVRKNYSKKTGSERTWGDPHKEGAAAMLALQQQHNKEVVAPSTNIAK